MILQNLQKCTTYNIDKFNIHTNLKHHTTNNEYITIISKNTNSHHKNLCHNWARQKPRFKTIFLILSHILYHETAFHMPGIFHLVDEIFIECVIWFLLFKVQTYTNTGD